MTYWAHAYGGALEWAWVGSTFVTLNYWVRKRYRRKTCPGEWRVCPEAGADFGQGQGGRRHGTKRHAWPRVVVKGRLGSW